VEHQLAELLARLEPNAIWLALTLPVAIRMVGHWIPEELFMIAVGVLAERAPSSRLAAGIVFAAWSGHFITDQAVYVAGRWIRPRLTRYPRIVPRLERVAGRLRASRGAIYALIPARVLPLGRAAWLAGAGVVGVRWLRFAAVDALALVVHVLVWCGLGWWAGGNLGVLAFSAEVAKVTAWWLAIAILAAATAVLTWRSRLMWRPSASRIVAAARNRFGR